MNCVNKEYGGKNDTGAMTAAENDCYLVGRIGFWWGEEIKIWWGERLLLEDFSRWGMGKFLTGAGGEGGEGSTYPPVGKTLH